MNWTAVIAVSVFVIQFFSIVAVIFLEKKDPTSTMAWVMALTFLPVIGMFFYVFFGRGLKLPVVRKLRKRKNLEEQLYQIIPQLGKGLEVTKNIAAGTLPEISTQEILASTGLIVSNYTYSHSVLTQNNTMKIYTDAQSHYKELFDEISKAQHTIHLVYFIISNNQAGHDLVHLLAKKAKEGVQVRLIYDDMGSITTPRKLFNLIRENGGEVYRFFPLKFGYIMHANYRTHHKIVIIDGKIAYTGGMNIGDEYMGLKPKHSPWRDTHMRITGDSVAALQFLFLLDLYYATGNEKLIISCLSDELFPVPEQTGDIAIQVVPSGPDNDHESIKRGLIKMIGMAKKKIYLQSPYLMPDKPMIEALQTAAASGVEVILMLPGLPDKKTVYHVTISYIQDMLDYGVQVYLYHGFLHSKMIVVDDEICSLGTTNLDIRSFALHFEVNEFIYDKKIAQQCSDFFLADIQNSDFLTSERYESRGIAERFLEKLLRFLAPLM